MDDRVHKAYFLLADAIESLNENISGVIFSENSETQQNIREEPFNTCINVDFLVK